MFTTVPLTLSKSYADVYIDSYSPIINPYFASTQINDKGEPLKTIYYPNPIKSYISPLGTAVHNNDPVVFNYKYNQFEKPKDKVALSISSPVSPAILSPTSLYATSLSPSILSAEMPINEESFNNDEEVQKRMTSYFFEKTINNWLHSDFDDVLKYLIVKSKKVQPVSNKKEYEKNKPHDNLDQKIKYIENNIMTKYDMKSFLKKFVLKTGIVWYKLRDHKDIVKKSISKKIKSNIQKLIEN